MKKCILILPYFGKFKPYFHIFLKSIENNEENLDLLLITDSDLSKYEIPKNVIVKQLTFSEFKYSIDQKFGFSVCLDRPYKLCDYKPAYGFIFEDLIKNYKYWGHCDCDLIFGDFNMINDLIETEYKKIFSGGHLTLYLNNYDNNREFMNTLNGEKIYEMAISNEKIYCLDEDYFQDNVHSIFLERYPSLIYTDDLSFNVSTKFYDFYRCKYNNKSRRWDTIGRRCILCLKDGKVFSIDKKNKYTEYLYAHFQMRNFKTIFVDNFSKPIYFEPNKIYNQDSIIDKSLVETFNVFFIKLKKRIQRIRDVIFVNNPKKYKNGIEFLNRKAKK